MGHGPTGSGSHTIHGHPTVDEIRDSAGYENLVAELTRAYGDNQWSITGIRADGMPADFTLQITASFGVAYFRVNKTQADHQSSARPLGMISALLPTVWSMPGSTQFSDGSWMIALHDISDLVPGASSSPQEGRMSGAVADYMRVAIMMARHPVILHRLRHSHPISDLDPGDTSTTPPSVVTVQGSLAFQNTLQAMDQVFSPGQWWTGTIYPGDVITDFDMWMDVGGHRHAALISVSDRRVSGLYARGLGGSVKIRLPGQRDGVYRAPDGTPITGMHGLFRGMLREGKSDRWNWGASGGSVTEIVDYLQFLKRHLNDKARTRQTGLKAWFGARAKASRSSLHSPPDRELLTYRTPEETMRNSLAFRNTLQAMDEVFGCGNWSIEGIEFDVPASDFRAWFIINGQHHAAYITAAETHTSGMYACGPGGNLGISVPEEWGSDNRALDGTWLRAVDELVLPPDEQGRWMFGADGANIAKITEYLHMLKVYLSGDTLHRVHTP